MQVFIVLYSAFLIIAFNCVDADEYRIIDTNYGQIRGIQKTTLFKQIEFYSFRGIPYAKSPTGELRFKVPEPVEPWTPKILNALEYSNTCVRPNNMFLVRDDFPQSEDCLFLNIFVPKTVSSDDKLAVMFWIHGGGFVEWSGNDQLFGPDFLLEQNVIVVTINYRLGVFGFLSFGTPEYSGNMGLKDQQLALKWVHENIEQFNGDNERITIFGESAGGASTHYQVLSRESRKYFNNAILMSGTTENIWALGCENRQISVAYNIANELAHPQNSVQDLIKFFKSADNDDLVYYGVQSGNHRKFSIDFAPIIEKKDASMPFITELPEEIYKTSDMDKDVIFIHTSSEFGAFFESLVVNVFDVWDINDDFSMDLPIRGFERFPFNSTEYRSVANEIRSFYFGDAKIDANVLNQYIDMMNDILFVYPNHRAIKYNLNSSKGKTFYFQFSVNSTLNFMKRLLHNVSPGTSHCDETCYIFRGDICQPYYDEIFANENSAETKVSRNTVTLITKLFTNFAKYGHPTPGDDLIAGYHPMKNNEIETLDINNDGLKVISHPRKESVEFWERLEEKAQQIIKDNAVQ